MALSHSERQKRWAVKNPSYAKSYRDEHKEAQHLVQKAWRERNYFRNAERVKKHQRRKVEFVNSLKDKPCFDCGKRYPPYVMHFDHRDPSTKYKSVSAMKCRSYDAIKREAEKCDVVCANCHAVRTHNGIAEGKIKIFGGYVCR